jgi:hypothetical protein
MSRILLTQASRHVWSRLTFDVSPRKPEGVISSRYMIRPLQKIMKAASRVIHVGDFGVLRDSTISRFVSSGSCVMHVGDFTPQIDFRVYALPMRDRFGIPFQVRTTANQAAKKRANIKGCSEG